ncbi:hypothetical protein HMPREF1478_01569 [Actinomyces sp. HPA0247]|nr:hypothetical protein HMPREF1478_01569 [Actinomyces sp. HPA0247]
MGEAVAPPVLLLRVSAVSAALSALAAVLV